MKTIGYRITADCKPNPDWYAFRVSKEGAKSVFDEMRDLGYKKVKIEKVTVK